MGFRRVTASGVGLRRLEKRNVKTIAAGLITGTVGYIVTFHLLGKDAPRTQRVIHRDYIN